MLFLRIENESEYLIKFVLIYRSAMVVLTGALWLAAIGFYGCLGAIRADSKCHITTMCEQECVCISE